MKTTQESPVKRVEAKATMRRMVILTAAVCVLVAACGSAASPAPRRRRAPWPRPLPSNRSRKLCRSPRSCRTLSIWGS